MTHEEFYQEQNKLDGEAIGLGEDLVNNEDIFYSDTGRINYPNEGGYKLDDEGNAMYETYDSLDDF